MSKVIITQPNYIPWKGYFSPMRNADYLVLYDDVQYTKGDWRNRNYLISHKGPELLTIPIKTKNNLTQKINDAKILDNKWKLKHLNFIKYNYSKTKYFKKYYEIFEDIYVNINTESLSEVNYIFTKKIIDLLDIKIKILKSSELNIFGDRNERLVNICKFLNSTTYLSAPNSKCYLNENLFEQNNIKIVYHDYNNFKEYKQNWDGFEHKVSIIDMFFNLGDKTINYFNETQPI